MKSNLKIPQPHFPEPILCFAWVAFIQLMIAGVFTLTISADPKNTALFGFSIQRLALVLAAVLLASSFLAAGLILKKRKYTLATAYEEIQRSPVHTLIHGISFVIIVWGWLSIFCPSYLFWKSAEYYERLQPLSIALGLSFFEFYLFAIIQQKKTDFQTALSHLDRKDWLPFVGFALAGIGFACFIAVTRIGLVQKTAFWNVPGIPLSGLQIFAMVIFIGLGIFFFSRSVPLHSLGQKIHAAWILPVLIFIVAIFVWGSTPMLKHVFSLQPTFPNFQPYPYSDARDHDIGAISILNGNGINFHDNTDKPLYMVFLSGLHLIAGYDYSILSWLQIIVLGLIPVILFYFGKKFHSLAFGVFLALIIIIRQQNAIMLSYKIASVNPKLLVTEMMTLLGVVLLTYLVFLWFRTKKIGFSLLAGGVIGAVSLIRLNPIFLFPAIACLMIPVFWKDSRANIRKHLFAYAFGFLLLMLPWFITGVDAEGRPWSLVKLFDVIRTRYEQPLNPEITSIPPAEPQIAAGTTAIKSTPFLMVNHFLHNISTSVLALPDSIIYDDLDTLSQREYWQDINNWTGEFPIPQASLIIGNLLLLAVGLGYSWRHYRWAGLAPLFIFLVYCLSLGSAMSSGSRYIVPIDWILYFYYALAIVLIIHWISRFFTKVENSEIIPSEQAPFPHFSERKAFSLSLVSLICIASLIPITNGWVPAITDPSDKQAAVAEMIKVQGITPQISESLVFGEIFYPYHRENNTVEFNLVTDTAAKKYSIIKKSYEQNILFDGEPVVLRLRAENEKQRVVAIYQLSHSSLQLIWEE